MLYHKQQYKHKPPATYGDCHRAALASLLELNLEEVPHFMQGLGPDDGAIFNQLQDDFLRERGLDCIVIAFETTKLEDVFACLMAMNGPKLFLLGGESANNCGHTVVASPNGIIWDPSQNDSGIIGPMKDGYYWITYIVGQLNLKE